jgi:hypothetical protein
MRPPDHDDDATTPRATRGCLCGAVRYEVRGPLRDVVCHCSRCRRTHGHVAAYAACAAADLALVGADALRWYEEDRDRARGFCGRCGGRVLWRAADRDTISIAAGALDEPTGLRTVAQIFTAGHGDPYALAGEGERFPGPLPPGALGPQT